MDKSGRSSESPNSSVLPHANDEIGVRGGDAGDLLAALVSSPQAELSLVLDRKWKVESEGHVILVANSPYVGPNLQLAPLDGMHDGLLEVLLFANQTKIEVITNMAQIAIRPGSDERIRRYQVHQVDIRTDPPMPVLADGFELGETPLSISVQGGALTMIAGKPGSENHG